MKICTRCNREIGYECFDEIDYRGKHYTICSDCYDDFLDEMGIDLDDMGNAKPKQKGAVMKVFKTKGGSTYKVTKTTKEEIQLENIENGLTYGASYRHLVQNILDGTVTVIEYSET